MHDLTITIIQPDLLWHDPQGNCEYLGKLIDNSQAETDLIILPEMFTTGFSMQARKLAEQTQEKTLQWMADIADKKNCVVTGSVAFKLDEGFANRLIWMQPDGQWQFYDKKHLFSFAGEDKRYQAGQQRKIFELHGWKILPLICYDLRFPVWSRNKNDYDLMICVANWPNPRRHAWQTLAKARAIENQSYVAVANRVGQDENGLQYAGDSMIVDYLGQALVHCTLVEQTATIQLSKKALLDFRSEFTFHADADEFSIDNLNKS